MDYAKAARNGAKLAVRYGPQAKLVWEHGGKQAATAAQKRALSMIARSKAFAEAETVRDGSVVKRVVDGSAIYVVLSGEKAVRVYPPQDAPLDSLLQDADLAQRVSVEEHREKQLRTRARKLRSRAPGIGTPDSADSEGREDSEDTSSGAEGITPPVRDAAG